MKNTLDDITQEFITDCFSLSDVARKLNFTLSGRAIKAIKNTINHKMLDTNHFNISKKRTVYERVAKICPVCGKHFIVNKGQSKEKITCSRACANTFFRSGKNHPNYKHTDKKDFGLEINSNYYRKICFTYHAKECVVCKENLIVEAHHFDGDKKNNSPDNLIPLCPTHHKYIHSKYAYLIKDTVEEYRKKFIESYKDKMV